MNNPLCKKWRINKKASKRNNQVFYQNWQGLMCCKYHSSRGLSFANTNIITSSSFLNSWLIFNDQVLFCQFLMRHFTLGCLAKICSCCVRSSFSVKKKSWWENWKCSAQSKNPRVNAKLWYISFNVTSPLWFSPKTFTKNGFTFSLQ